MRNLAKFMAASTFALSVAAMAGQSQAQTFAQWLPLGFGTNFAFINNGADTDGNGLADNGTGGAFFSTSTPTGTMPGATSVVFSLDGHMVAADLTFNSTVTGTPASFDGATYLQTGVNGSFSVKAHGDQTFGSLNVTDGSNLLSGGFTDAWIQGIGTSGGIDLSLGNGGSMSTPFTSSYIDFTHVVVPSENFNITLGAIVNGRNHIRGINQVASTDALESFRASGVGGFQAAMVAVPEPAAWALMIVGFGGVGVALRRRSAAVA